MHNNIIPINEKTTDLELQLKQATEFLNNELEQLNQPNETIEKLDKHINIINVNRQSELYNELSMFLVQYGIKDENILSSMAQGLNIQKNMYLSDTQIKEVVSSVLENNKQPVSFLSNNGKVIPYELANYIIANKHITSDINNIYLYNGKHYELVDNMFYDVIDKLVHNKRSFTKNLRIAVTDHIQNQTRYAINSESKYINFKNGLYNVENRVLEPHNYLDFSLGIYNAEYDEKKADITGTAWEHYLKTTLDESLIPTIQEMIGLCLYPLTKRTQKCFALVGGGSNGKSILLNTIKSIIPPHLCSNISMEDYDKQFTNYSIKGKKVNIQTDDTTTHLDRIGNFKKVMSGESIFVERKGIDGEEIEVNLTHISSFNRLPSVNEKSEAFFRRLVIIPFDNSFGTLEQVQNGERDLVANPILEEQIKQELDIIVAWAIRGLHRIIRNNYIITESDSIKQAKADYTEDTDLVAKWIKECIVKHSELPNKDCLKATFLYRAYLEWARNEGYTELKRKAFDERIKQLLKKQSHSFRRNIVYKVSFKGFNCND